MNLLTGEMLDAPQSAFDIIANDSTIKVVVLSGAGKGFCAGHDLKEIRELHEQPRIEQLFHNCSRKMISIVRLPQPMSVCREPRRLRAANTSRSVTSPWRPKPQSSLRLA